MFAQPQQQELSAPVDYPRPHLRRSNVLREIIETILLIAIVYTLVNLATVRFYIEGPSMEPNFYRNQFLIVSRLNYLFGEPARGDVVVFDPPGDDTPEPLLIKRLIGLPGETVEIRDTQVYINGTLLDEPYTNEPCNITRCPNREWVLGENEYFFMGDNRNNSRDSRVFGVVTRDRIIGEAVVRYWPIQDVAIFSGYRYSSSSE